MKRSDFLAIYQRHLATAKTKLEAYELAEADHIFLEGKRKYPNYAGLANSISKARKRGVKIPKLNANGKATMEAFLAVYYEYLPEVPMYKVAYELAEQWHIGKFGLRRFKNHQTFDTAYYRQRNKAA